MPDMTRERIDEIRRRACPPDGAPVNVFLLVENAARWRSDAMDLLSALDRRDELLKWVAGQSVLGVVVRALADHPKSECGKNAREILDIVGDDHADQG